MINRKHNVKNIRKAIKLIFILGMIGMLIVFSINFIVIAKTSNYINEDIMDVPEKQAIIILGAYVNGDNLSLVLEDRITAGIDLFDVGKSDRILLSGDHGQEHYDEVNAMRRYVLKNGSVDENDIFLDHAGFDTYDSLYRAKEIFGIESAIIVTQAFHINRSVYIARELGIDAEGYSVNQDKYKRILQVKWFVRESLSRVKAFLDVVFKSEPKYLGEMIPISGDGHLSWDKFN